MTEFGLSQAIDPILKKKMLQMLPFKLPFQIGVAAISPSAAVERWQLNAAGLPFRDGERELREVPRPAGGLHHAAGMGGLPRRA